MKNLLFELFEFDKNFRDEKGAGFIRYIIIVAVVLIAVFFSQHAYFKGIKSLSLPGSGLISEYWAKGANWVKDVVLPKLSGEAQKRGDAIKTEMNQEKEKISESIGEKIKNYFSGVVDSIFHPGKNTNNTSDTNDNAGSVNSSQNCQSIQP